MIYKEIKNGWPCHSSLFPSMLTNFFSKNLHINANVKSALQEIGLCEFQDFMNYSEGQLVSRAAKLPVRTLYLMVDGQQRKYFLKKKASRFPYGALRVWFRVQNPPLKITRELRILELMREMSIPTMTPVAWGALKILGCSIKGFILVEEVIGKPFIDVYQKSSLRVRRRLFRVYGALMGVLHRKGIDSKVRPQDLMCVSDDYANFQNCLVLIDREHGRPHLVKLSIEQCGVRLGEIWVKGTHRIGLGERTELLAFLSGYLSEAGWQSGGLECMKLMEQTSGRATEVLYQGHRFAHLRKGFQGQYNIGAKTPAENQRILRKGKEASLANSGSRAGSISAKKLVHQLAR